MIQDGLVKINGKICSMGDDVNVGEDTVVVNGKVVSVVKHFDYYISFLAWLQLVFCKKIVSCKIIYGIQNGFSCQTVRIMI